MKKQKVIIIDDHQLNLILLERILRKLDLELTTSLSARKAIELLINDGDYDLILMDVQMPDMDGFEALKIIKENDKIKDIPVIFVTAYNVQSEFIQHGFNLGAFDYITKPFDENALIGKVKLYLSLQTEKKVNIEITNRLKSMNRSINILNECNTALLYSGNEIEILNSFCRILVEIGGFSLVWIGKIKNKDDFTKNTIIPLVSYFNEEGNIIKNFENIIQDTIISCEFVSSDKKNIELTCDKNHCLFCEVMQFEKGFNVISLKINPEINLNYVLNLYAPVSYIYSAEEKELLDSISSSLNYGFTALIEKEKRKQFQLELAKEKEELSTTLRGIADGVIFFLLDGKIMYFNEAAARILGLTTAEIRDKNIYELFKLDGDESLFNPMNLTNNIKDGEYNTFQLNIITWQNKKVILSGKIAVTVNDNLKPEGLTLVFQDISQQIRIANQLSLSQKMESVGQLASGIAHEINTPLQFIGDNNYFLNDAVDSLIEYIDFIDSEIEKFASENQNLQFAEKIKNEKNDLNIEFLTEEIKNALKSNRDGIQRVSNIVLAMKNFAHPSGKQKVLSNINEAIEITTVISKNEWKYDVNLELILKPELPPVYCIPDEINQFILNMIINSTHAIQEKFKNSEIEKQGNLRIETDYNDKWIIIKINDNGNGISKDNISRIFDPFFTTKPVGKGTGQGLAITHDIIVNKHNGRIEVESEPEVYTKFIISLPRQI